MVAASKHNVESATLRNVARKKTMYSCKRACALKNSCMRSFQMTINLDAEYTFHLLNDYYICIVMTAPSSPVFSPMPYLSFSSITHGSGPAEGFFPLKGSFSLPMLLVLDQILVSVESIGQILTVADAI